MTLAADIHAYQPFNQQEVADKQVILHALETDPSAFDRHAQAHMTCSVWTVDPAKTCALMAYHNLYDSWSWIGGHADGERNLAHVALRELAEETGVANARLIPCDANSIFSLEVLTVNGHVKRDSYISSHLHLNVTYLAIASMDEPLRAKPDENSAVKWIPLDKVCAASSEPWIRDRIYRKLLDKTAAANFNQAT